MKETPLTLSIKKMISAKLEAVDKILVEMIEPLEKVGSPEQLIGKPYESWTPEDLQKLTIIYGTKEPNPLSRVIFNREYQKVLADEQEVK